MQRVTSTRRTTRRRSATDNRDATSAPPEVNLVTGFVAYSEGRTEDNHDFRRVLYTGLHMQLLVMLLLPGEQIGEEVRDLTDEFRREEDAGARSSSTSTWLQSRVPWRCRSGVELVAAACD